MKVQGTNNTYTGIKLAQSDEKKVNKLLFDLTNTQQVEQVDILKEKLLDIFDKHLKNEANKHSVFFVHKDDLQQRLYLNFFVLLMT